MSKKLLFFVFSLLMLVGTSAMAHVTLDHPSGGETFVSGNSVSIEWHIYIDHGDCTWTLYYSPDNGQTWQTITTGLPKSQVTYEWAVPEKSTDSGLIQVVQNNKNYANQKDESNTFTITSASNVDSKTSQPGKFSLQPAFPNPFNGSTVFSFTLDKADHIKLQIFDIIGHEIQILIDAQMSQGIHNVTWQPQGIASGVYLCRITNGETSLVQRVLYIR